MKLVIVESPTKSKTIKKFLPSNYQIVASFGHLMDLPQKEFGIDVKNNFKMKYVLLKKAKKILPKIKKLSQKAEMVILNTDPDREGEVIAWHLVSLLNLDENSYQRMVIYEITKEAILKALKNPKKIDLNLVKAQQTRRILDRIVGYKLSPFLWRKVAKGLSAGRVQSVALRLVVEREKEIENFIPQKYFKILAIFKKGEKEFEGELIKIEKRKIKRFEIKERKKAEKIVRELKKKDFRVKKITEKIVKRTPPPPFISATLIQNASSKFGWSSKKTMNLAQILYEKGLISYHRTDSYHLSDHPLNEAKEYILKKIGQNYWQFRRFKRKSKLAQEAHEAIRPTSVFEIENLKLEKDLLKLYQLIWKRFIASQMKEAIFEKKEIEIEANGYLFSSKGLTLKFDGFLKVWPIFFKEKTFPPLLKGEKLHLEKIKAVELSTPFPKRYTEAKLIKELERNGIGRPSTYPLVISTLLKRNYLRKIKGYFRPTEIGVLVSDILVKNFPEIVDLKFTAKMEDFLDEIAQGKRNYLSVLKNFYHSFSKVLKEKYRTVEKEVSLTEKKCPQCGAQLILRISKYGRFYGCSNFPKCRYKKDFKESRRSEK